MRNLIKGTKNILFIQVTNKVIILLFIRAMYKFHITGIPIFLLIMGRVKSLNKEEVAKIWAFKSLGLSNRVIAQKINRSPTAVDNVVKLKDNYGKKWKTSGNKKLSRQQKAAIIRSAVAGNVTATQIKNELGLPVGKRRIQQILSKSNRVKWQKRQKKPALTDQHKRNRLDFARNHMPWSEEWKNVIFSDEKKFNLDGPDGFQYYWHDLQAEKQISMSRNFGGGTVMTWAAFSFYGKTPICMISTRMNSENYTDLLEDVLIEFGEQQPDQNWIFQQDNAAIHKSRHTMRWLNDRNIEILNWPARSPDLNPIENLWGILSRGVYANGKQYHTVQELKMGIREAWATIPASTLEKLVLSMPNRIFEVINKNGGYTKY